MIILIFPILIFAAQFFLCFKGNKTAKHIPVYILLICFILSILLYAGIFGKWGTADPEKQLLGIVYHGGYEPTYQILAVFFFIITGAACLADGAAWTAYKIWLRALCRKGER
ncbi:MAG: hypothetical protein LUD81_03850 [Clostridiales bacterium]|nr:hypothetical protein [Clostridiales bacterium]